MPKFAVLLLSIIFLSNFGGCCSEAMMDKSGSLSRFRDEDTNSSARRINALMKKSENRSTHESSVAQSLEERKSPKAAGTTVDSTTAERYAEEPLLKTPLKQVTEQNLLELVELLSVEGKTEKARIILSEIGELAVPCLINVLKDKERCTKVRIEITRILGTIGDERAQEPLYDIWLFDKKEAPEVKAAARKAWRKLFPPLFMPHSLPDNEDILFYWHMSLTMTFDPKFQDLSISFFSRFLPEMKEQIFNLMNHILISSEYADHVKLRAICEIGTIGDKKSVRLLTSMFTEDVFRNRAIDVLSARSILLGPENEILPELVELLGSKDDKVSDAAFKTIVLMEDAAIDRLIEAVAQERETSLKVKIVQLLAKLEAYEAVETLIDELDDSNPNVQPVIRKALVQLCEEDFGINPKKWKDWLEANKHTIKKKETQRDRRLKQEALKETERLRRKAKKIEKQQ